MNKKVYTSEKSWRIIVITLLILGLLLSLSACQLGKDLQNTAHAFSQLPGRLIQGLTNLMGGLKGIGTALADSVGNMVRGMTGR